MKLFSTFIGGLSLWLAGGAASTLKSMADTYFNLGIPSTFSAAQAITPDGSIIVGVSKNADARNHLFKWTQAEGMTDFGVPPTAEFNSVQLVSTAGDVIVGFLQVGKNPGYQVFRWTAAVGTQVLPMLNSSASKKLLMTGDGAVVVGGGLTATQEAHAFRWTNGEWVDLGTLGGTVSTAIAISADGTVISGTSTTASGEQHAFRWTADGMVDLGTLGGNNSLPFAMSADGAVVVGVSTTSSGEQHAFRWTLAAGAMQDLGTLGGAFSVARFISIDGSSIVGDSATALGENHAFRWTEAGGMEDLGSLGGSKTTARAISQDGSVVVGISQRASGPDSAFRWQVGGAIQDLGSLGGDSGEASEPTFVSADGTVVIGNSATSSGAEHLFRWEVATQTMLDLGTIAGRSVYSAISADGRIIVGNGLNSSGEPHAYRSTETGWADLGQLGSFLNRSEVQAITPDGGTVVGFGTHSGDVDYVRAFRWTEGEGFVHLPTLGGAQSRAFAVSADGTVVVGNSDTGGRLGSPRSSGLHAFRWTAADGTLDLGTLEPGLFFSEARAISSDGSVIVGVSDTANGYTQGFRWTQNQGMLPLGTLGDDFQFSDPQIVSTDGSTIVGVYGTSTEVRVFQWKDGAMTDIGSSSLYVGGISADGSVLVGSLEGQAVRLENGNPVILDTGGLYTSSQATAVSADGVTVTGWGDAGLGVRHTFRWTSTSGMRDLGALSDLEGSAASAISGDGSTILGSSGRSPFLWTESLGMASLGERLASLAPGELISEARAVSFDGTVIIGQASNSSVSHSPRHGFVARLTSSSPLANAGPDQTVVAGATTCSATVDLDGSASSGSGLEFTWSEEGQVIATGATPTVTLEAGSHKISLQVQNAQGQISWDTLLVVVQDTTAPIPDLAALADLSAVCEVKVKLHPTATDACVGTIMATTTDPVLYTVPGTYILTWTFDDGHGNITTQPQTITVLPPYPTALSYNGATSSTAGSTVVLSARLTDGPGKKAPGLLGRVVVFTLGATTATAVTDSTGTAQVTVTAPTKLGDYPLSAIFNGVCPYGSSTVSRTFTVKKK